MKLYIVPITFLLLSGIFTSSCKHILPPKDSEGKLNDTIVAAEFTGVKRFMSGEKLIKEVTFKNGIREGLNKNYYDDGRLKSTIWYSNNLKSDTARWYYPDGKVYRSTPYTSDKINGVQKKFHKNGSIMAEIPYKMGLRTPGLREYYDNGLPVKGMPSILTELNDSYYKSDGKFRVLLRLSNESTDVEFFQGSLVDGAFDPSVSKKVTISSGMGFVELNRDRDRGRNYVDIIAVYTTRFNNKEILTKRVRLPYNDLY